MKTYAFNAMLARMKYITRWGLMRSTRSENLSEHTAEVSILAHTLCLISNKIYGQSTNGEKVAVAALYHDASEIITGDMPTPVKYKRKELQNAYKALERDAASDLLKLLPEELKADMSAYLHGDNLNEKEKQLLKAADRLSALIKCIEEENSGNKEFAGAKKGQHDALLAMNCPEAEYFLKNMLPCYDMTLDELSVQS